MIGKWFCGKSRSQAGPRSMNIQITTHQVNLLTVNALCKLQFLLNDALHKCGLCLWMDRHLSVHPALCLSHTGILSKWQNIFSRFFHCLVAHHSDISVPNFRFQILGQMTPKVKIFENIFPDSATGHRTAFCDQIWWKSAVAKLPKGPLDYHPKKLGLRFIRPSTHGHSSNPFVFLGVQNLQQTQIIG